MPEFVPAAALLARRAGVAHSWAAKYVNQRDLGESLRSGRRVATNTRPQWEETVLLKQMHLSKTRGSLSNGRLIIEQLEVIDSKMVARDGIGLPPY
jgi:hypothetical protein